MSLLPRLLRTVTRRFVKVVYVFAGDVTSELPTAPPRSGVEVRLFRGESDASTACATLASAGLEASEVTRRLRQGDLVSVAFVHGQVAGYTWMTFTDAPFHEIGRTFRVGAHEAVQYDALVVREFRGRGLQFVMNAPVLEYARQSGLARTLSWVDAFNARSHKTQLRTGKRKIMTIVSVKLPGTQRRWNFALGTRLSTRVY